MGSMGLIIIKYYKYYYKSQIAYFFSFLDFLDENHNEILNKNFIFKKFYTKFSSKQMIRMLLSFILFNLIYSIIMYFIDDHLMGNGFCVMR